MKQPQIDAANFEFPLQISTHEKCSNPCPGFRDRIKGHEEFEFDGFWGPRINTAQDETIAEGHKSLSVVLDAVLGAEYKSTATRSCEMWDCENEATHTVEVDTGHRRYTDYRCVECVDRSAVATVDEGLGVKICDNERCFNVIHESRTYCTSHVSDQA